MKKSEIINKIKKLNILLGKYVVIAGASLAIRGIRETSDIDILVSPEIYEKFRKKGWKEKKKHEKIILLKDDIEMVTSRNAPRHHFDSDKMIRNAEIIDAIPCSRLDDETKIKKV